MGGIKAKCPYCGKEFEVGKTILIIRRTASKIELIDPETGKVID